MLKLCEKSFTTIMEILQQVRENTLKRNVIENFNKEINKNLMDILELKKKPPNNNNKTPL